jgi:Tfp pilus assembly protein PilN
MVAINLIPESTQIAQARRRHAARWAVVVFVAGLACALPWTAHWAQHARIEELKSINDQLQTDLHGARTELKRVSSEAADLLLRIERARALREKRSWSAMMALIASTLPRDCWLTSVATDPPSAAAGATPARKAAPTPAAPAPGGPAPPKPAAVTVEAPRKLRLVGNASNSTEPLVFVAALKEARVFQEVVLEQATAEGDQKTPLFRFEVRCEW